MSRSREKCVQLLHALRRELHWSKLCFTHWDWRPFAHSPWLPHTVKAQWVYLLYRAVVAFYFPVWLITSCVNAGSPKVLIYLSQWSFIALNAYLVVAFFTTVINLFLAHVYPKKRTITVSPDDENDKDEETVGKKCCLGGQTTLCDKLAWLLFVIGAESAILVVLLFWALLGTDSDTKISVSVHYHVLNGVVGLLELWITGLPVHLLHFVYLCLVATTYSAFTGVYYGVNGTGYEDEPYIYQVLDYESQPETAAGTILVSIFVLCPLIHLFFYLQYLLRRWLTTLLQSAKLYQRYSHPVDMSAPTPVLY